MFPKILFQNTDPGFCTLRHALNFVANNLNFNYTSNLSIMMLITYENIFLKISVLRKRVKEQSCIRQLLSSR